MQVLLVTDSSYCPDTGAAGWAVIAISERGELFTGGIIQKKMQTNNIAECVALANGLKAAVDAGIIKHNDEIRCLSDSHYVRDRMRPGYVGKTAKATAKRTGLPPYALGSVGSPKSIVQAFIHKYQLTLTVEFIDGHGRSGKPKSKHDRLMKKVDKLSRENMNRRRNVLARLAFL